MHDVGRCRRGIGEEGKEGESGKNGRKKERRTKRWTGRGRKFKFCLRLILQTKEF